MENPTKDELIFHLSSRIKFLEKNYSALYTLTTKLTLLKPQDFINQNRILPVKESLKTLPKPDFSLEDYKSLFIPIYESSKQSIKEKVSQAKYPEIFPIFENFYTQIIKYAQGTYLDRLMPNRSPCKLGDRAIRQYEKKISTFQREARKPSFEKNNGSRDVTPKKAPSKNLSVSPSEKRVHYMNQENSELREQVKKIGEERDLLRAWKENMLRAPNSFSEECNSIIKQQELFSKQLIISNKVLISKVQALVNSVLRFLKDTSSFQKILREKEGFLSINYYENEKSKIKVKLKELAEVKDIQVFLVDLPFLAQNGSIDFSQFTEKYLGIESENKTLKIQLKDAQKKVRKFGSLSSERLYSETGKKEEDETLKNWVEKRINEVNQEFSSVFGKISQRIDEKEKVLENYRTKFVESLRDNLKCVVDLKNNLKVSIDKTPDTEVLTTHIKSLEYLIDQNRFYKEVEIQELSQTIELLEKQRTEQNQEILALKLEKIDTQQKLSQFNEIEQQLLTGQTLVEELEGKNLGLNKKIREFKQREIKYNEDSYERSILESEVQKLISEIEVKQQVIEELQKALSLEQIKSGSSLDEVLLKESAAQKELEIVKIELSTYKMQITVLENINEDLEKRVQSFEAV